jgi:hypothetical protein
MLNPEEKSLILAILFAGGSLSDAQLENTITIEQTIRSLLSKRFIHRGVDRKTQDSVMCLSDAGLQYIKENICLF